MARRLLAVRTVADSSCTVAAVSDPRNSAVARPQPSDTVKEERRSSRKNR